MNFKELVWKIIEKVNSTWNSTLVIEWADFKNDLLLKLAKVAWSVSEWKHHGQTRDSWEDYIHHPIAVARNNLENSQQYNIKQTLVDLLHDVLEDTNVSFKTMKYLFWNDIALAVLAVSKQSFSNFIYPMHINDYKTLQYVKNSWVLNSELGLADLYQSVIRRVESILSSQEWGKKTKLNSEGKIRSQKDIFLRQWLSQKEFEWIVGFTKLANTKTYKAQRNKLNDYRLLHWVETVTELAKANDIDLTAAEINAIAILAATTKTGDRRHNNAHPKNNKQHLKNIEGTQNIIIPWAISVLWENHPNIKELQEQVENTYN